MSEWAGMFWFCVKIRLLVSRLTVWGCLKIIFSTFILSKKGIICDKISYSNLMVSCFTFRSLINVINYSFVFFHIINISSIYRKSSRNICLIHSSSNFVINRLASDGVLIVPPYCGRSSLQFFQNWKKYPDFGKKSPDYIHLWVKLLM